jgi:hypothetical protein
LFSTCSEALLPLRCFAAWRIFIDFVARPEGGRHRHTRTVRHPVCSYTDLADQRSAGIESTLRRARNASQRTRRGRPPKQPRGARGLTTPHLIHLLLEQGSESVGLPAEDAASIFDDFPLPQLGREQAACVLLMFVAWSCVCSSRLACSPRFVLSSEVSTSQTHVSKHYWIGQRVLFCWGVFVGYMLQTRDGLCITAGVTLMKI